MPRRHKRPEKPVSRTPVSRFKDGQKVQVHPRQRRDASVDQATDACITTPKTTDNKSAAGNSAQAKTQAVALGTSEHSGKLFKSKVGANGFEPSTSCSQGRRANQAALRPAVTAY